MCQPFPSNTAGGRPLAREPRCDEKREDTKRKETRAAARVQPSVEATAAIDAKIAQAKALPGEVSE